MIDQKAAQEHLQRILSGEFKPQTEEETNAFQRLSQLTTEMNGAQQESASLAQRSAELKVKADRLAGKREAYIEVLINIEMKRQKIRAAGDKYPQGKTQEPISLEEMRKKMGAVSIEAYDADGNLIEKTEGSDDAESRKQGREGSEAAGKPESTGPVPPQD